MTASGPSRSAGDCYQIGQNLVPTIVTFGEYNYTRRGRSCATGQGGPDWLCCIRHIKNTLLLSNQEIRARHPREPQRQKPPFALLRQARPRHVATGHAGRIGSSHAAGGPGREPGPDQLWHPDDGSFAARNQHVSMDLVRAAAAPPNPWAWIERASLVAAQSLGQASTRGRKRPTASQTNGGTRALARAATQSTGRPAGSFLFLFATWGHRMAARFGRTAGAAQADPPTHRS